MCTHVPKIVLYLNFILFVNLWCFILLRNVQFNIFDICYSVTNPRGELLLIAASTITWPPAVTGGQWTHVAGLIITEVYDSFSEFTTRKIDHIHC